MRFNFKEITKLHSFEKNTLHFCHSQTVEASAAFEELTSFYGQCDKAKAKCLVALGGDGFLLHTLQQSLDLNIPVFGMNCGSIGFLLNPLRHDDLLNRLNQAKPYKLFPLHMKAIDKNGKSHERLAINEVSLLRQRHQTAKLSIQIDNVMRMEELICDGALVSTPAGSTAYNFSAHGPILPLTSNLMALTPISAFRPRRWRGALLNESARVVFEVLEADKRPVSAVADDQEIRDVVHVEISVDHTHPYVLLFDPDHGWEERILQEQFSKE